MKKFEIFLAIIAIVSTVLGFLHVPSAVTGVVLSFGVLAMLYYPFGFMLLNDIRVRDVFKKESYQDKSILRIAGSGMVGMVYSVIVIGILFKIQFYPGADVMLDAGMGGSLIVLVVLVFKWMKSKDPFYAKTLKRTLIIGTLLLMAWAMPYRTLVEWRISDDPEYVDALVNSLENPGNIELREIEQQEREKYYQRGNEQNQDE